MYIMLVDDGWVSLPDALYHIYVSRLSNKVFEGRISSKNEFEIIMKALGGVPRRK